MCGTCGCGDSNMITITKIGEEEKHEHYHMLDNMHTHSNNTLGHDQPHTHAHDHHHHHHEHNHVTSVTAGVKTVIDLEHDILHENNLLAERNRGYFEAKNILAINLVSSPGSGKTSLLEKTLIDLSTEITCSVIEGDQQTSNDADRIAKTKAPVVQINTGKGCHLDAKMINKALKQLNPDNNSLVFVENVGNLVCPALFNLGEGKRVVIMSVTEGDDKPIKYPDMFHTSQLCIINKIDLLPYVNFNLEKAREYARRVNPQLEFIELSATTGEGMDAWYNWLRNKRG